MRLYSRSGSGALLFWQMEENPDEFCLDILYGTIGGATKNKQIPIVLNNSGRDIYEQCSLEADARVNKKKQQGYTVEAPAKGAEITNALGLPRPMLAKKYDGKTIHDKNAIIQPKLDGNRCIIRIGVDGNIMPYTRNGKLIDTLSHITLELSQIPISIKEDTFIDGELYCHGQSLQTIVSWVKRKQENTKRIKFVAYDVIMDKEYPDRHLWLRNQLSNLFNTTVIGGIQVLPDEDGVFTRTKLQKNMMEYREQGYEGAIVRLSGSGYESGKRSKNLIKVKHWEDDEFLIVGVKITNDGFGVFELRAKNKKTFRCNPPGDFEFREYVANNQDEFIGKQVVVEYANLTKDGIPFHPVAKCMIADKSV